MSQYATYSPEDNKLRLYIGRVSREEYQKLKAEGWATLHKQRETGGGDFSAVWTPGRRDTALEYSEDGVIYDEDMGPAERAADKAERFSGYRDKRTNEACGHADRFEAQPTAHGFQSEERAERAAARHDRIGDRATDAWSKAEYWTRRTSGVISHALHLSSPSVRMGRIKTIEAELRAAEKSQGGHVEHFRMVQKIAANPEAAVKAHAVRWYGGDLAKGESSVCEQIAGGGKHHNPCNLKAPQAYYFEHIKSENPPTVKDYAEHFLATHHDPESEGFLLTNCGSTIQHLKLRLAYENQMLEAQGGRAAHVEMIPGGWLGSHQVLKVNKSPVTGRVVSVEVMGTTRGFTKESGYKIEETRPCPVLVKTERLAVDAYQAPTEEELATFNAQRKAAKAAKPKTVKPPLVNPTDEDAERLIAMWNAVRLEQHEKGNIYSSESARKMHTDQFKPCEVRKMPQAFYSAHSKGSYAQAGTKELCSLGRLQERNKFYDYSGQAKRAKERGPTVCEIRATGYDPLHVIILTDKPQKPLPAAVWEDYTPTEAPAEPVNA